MSRDHFSALERAGFGSNVHEVAADGSCRVLCIDHCREGRIEHENSLGGLSGRHGRDAPELQEQTGGNIVGKDKNGSFGWLLSQSGERKGKFVLSVILAAFSMICGIVPYYFIARIVKDLLAGSTDKSAYILNCGIILALWLGHSLFQAIFDGQLAPCDLPHPCGDKEEGA